MSILLRAEEQFDKEDRKGEEVQTKDTIMIRQLQVYKNVYQWRVGTRPFHSRRFILKQKHKDVQPREPAITRFAPSPTGLLHMGSLRTALYNYLLAKNTSGKFILRLEDTDRTRYQEEAESNILETLNWCGIKWDGPMFKQSVRTQEGLYKEYVDKLLEKGAAYKCFCSKDRLSSFRHDGYDRHCERLTTEEVENLQKVEKKPYTVRLKMVKAENYVTDLLHGKVLIKERKDRRGYDDPIILKSDGFPTYHLANVVDDHLMGITHVIRGEEWLSSTPKHLAIYEAFGWTPPNFIHIPLLTNLKNDKKLSKRQGDASVYAMKRAGILPESLVNFVALLGWAPPRSISQKTHECFTLNKLVDLFNLNYLTKGNVKVDDKKLKFFNKHFLQKKIQSDKVNELVKEIVPLCNENFNQDKISESQIKDILIKCGDSLSNINEFTESFGYFFEKPLYNPRNEEFITEKNKDDIIRLVKIVKKQVIEGGKQTHELLERIMNEGRLSTLDKRTIYKSIRYGLTGLTSGTKLPVIIDLLGSKESQNRLNDFESYIATL
ncbi:Glutamate--tRNA ligase mitochondrial [Monosporozyma unispora]|nr:Glutamate--tRNA ligase mitochondrial [Kazachstania unispora]